jgi:hypothetical protein
MGDKVVWGEQKLKRKKGGSSQWLVMEKHFVCFIIRYLGSV